MDSLPIHKIDHIYFDSFDELRKRERVWPEAVDRTLKPNKIKNGLKTLICHDKQGGYLPEDKLEAFEVVDSKSKPFVFTYFWYTDIFIYFSHHFITVPPVKWINQTHDHDVLCIGTFITEGKHGHALCAEIFGNQENVNTLIDHLVCLCLEFHFDGWLINIENEMDPQHLKNLLFFLHKLKCELKERVGPHSQFIWYDSIKEDGKLNWQNQLNEHNVVFAELVDGFYANYAWTRKELKQTNHYLEFEKPHISKTDIYFGVDIFGRGSFGGGQFNSHIAVQAARNYGFSVALFAPGWSTECFTETKDWFCDHKKLFSPMSDTLYPHRARRSFHADFSTGLCAEVYEPRRRTIFPFLLESEHLLMTCKGLQIEGTKDSEYVLFLTDFRCVAQYRLNYDCPDKLLVNVTTKQCAYPFIERMNIWQISCIKLTDDPCTSNLFDVQS
ncbi:Mannosyl-glycoprotein endo-beta-N-acetylglucosaminidase [Aphelenchoides bicaudatus]|nr:Mannosyl-glycoprotein endo-beta-N-acetylglucosaminidase [Aphelenchoides bicaudatus]